VRRSHPAVMCFVNRLFLPIHHRVLNRRNVTRKTHYILHLKPTGLNPILLCLISNSLEPWQVLWTPTNSLNRLKQWLRPHYKIWSYMPNWSNWMQKTQLRRHTEIYVSPLTIST